MQVAVPVEGHWLEQAGRERPRQSAGHSRSVQGRRTSRHGRGSTGGAPGAPGAPGIPEAPGAPAGGNSGASSIRAFTPAVAGAFGLGGGFISQAMPATPVASPLRPQLPSDASRFRSA